MVPRSGTLPTSVTNIEFSCSCWLSLRLISPNTPTRRCPRVSAYRYQHLKSKNNQQLLHSLTPLANEVACGRCQMHIWCENVDIGPMSLSFLPYKTFVLWLVAWTSGRWSTSLPCRGSIATQKETFDWCKGLEDPWLPPLTSLWDDFPRSSSLAILWSRHPSTGVQLLCRWLVVPFHHPYWTLNVFADEHLQLSYRLEVLFKLVLLRR